MASVLNRLTNQFLPAVNTPDFPESDWVVNPDLSGVIGFASKYWIVKGDEVSLMDQGARDVVDATEIAVIKSQIEADAAKAVTDGTKSPTPAGMANLEDRVRALELKVYGG